MKAYSFNLEVDTDYLNEIPVYLDNLTILTLSQVGLTKIKPIQNITVAANVVKRDNVPVVQGVRSNAPSSRPLVCI